MKRPIVLLVAVAAIAAACSGSVFSLEVGDCFNDPDPGAEQIANVEVSGCDTAHDNEVYALIDLTDTTGPAYPGDFAINQLGGDSCLDRFADYVGSERSNSKFGFSFLTPSEDSWGSGDREVICYLFDFNGETLIETAQNSGL